MAGNNDLFIQILDIQSRDQTIESETQDSVEVSYDDPNSCDSDGDTNSIPDYINRQSHKTTSTKTSEYVVHIFGTTQEGKPVRADITGFRPSFFIQLPEKNTLQAIEVIRRYISNQKIWSNQYTLSHVSSMQFYGFTANHMFPFLKIDVPSLNLFYRLKSLFLNKKCIPETRINLGPVFGNTSPPVFEANIDPMLRFIHTQNINPCGWVKLIDGQLLIENKSAPDWVINCNYMDVIPAIINTVAPFLVASWDIECYSVTGDFPLAKRTWTGLAKRVLTQKEYTPESIRHLIITQLENNAMYTIKSHKRLDTMLSGSELIPVLLNCIKSISGTTYSSEQLASTANILASRLGNIIGLIGDPVIQIGTTLIKCLTNQERHLFVFPDCSPITDIIVHSFENEAAMINGWFEWICVQNPDILIGYNVFGFDEKYIWERAEELGIIGQSSPIHSITRLNSLGTNVKCEEKFLSSSALGDNFMHTWSTHGRLQIDLYHYVRRMTMLPSYKLDSVVKHYMSGKLIGKADRHTIDAQLVLSISGAIKDVRPGRSICLLDDTGETVTSKLSVVSIDSTDKTCIIIVSYNKQDEESFDLDDATKWVIVKDDVSPQDIFRLHKGNADDRAIVGKYCIQDCDLVYELYKKLEVFNNAMSMANVCSVPVSYIFTRGQGIKIESLIFKACRDRNILIQVLPIPARNFNGNTAGDEEDVHNEDSYEGAIVLDPKPGFYSESPVGVADFASLYPSTIVSENISHDSLVWTKDYNADGTLINTVWGSTLYDNMTEFGYTDIEFDLLRPDPADKRKHPVKIKVGLRICRYAQPLDGSKSTLPSIICHLLDQRKATRKEAAKEKNPDRASILDAMQLAYKLTANSLYGQLGSETFKIRLQHLAASVTAYGRKQLMFAKDVIERFYGNTPRCAARCNANVVYGDSVSADTPLILQYAGQNTRDSNQICILRICDIIGSTRSNVWKQCNDGKEFVNLLPYNIRVWSEKGFTVIHSIIRHRLGPVKKMYRVTTQVGIVDVTEDHSLVCETGEAMKTSDVKIQTRLLYKYLDIQTTFSKLNDETNTGGETEIFQYGKNIAENKNNCNQTRYIDSINTIINSSLRTIKAFWRGLCAGYNVGYNNDYIQIEEHSKYIGSYIYIIGQILGYIVTIDYIANTFSDLQRIDKSAYVYTLVRAGSDISKYSNQHNKNSVQKIIELPRAHNSETYVYDIETANHHFGVGPGSLIVHNTDSLFVEFNPKNPETGERLTGREARQATIDLTEEAGKLVTKALKPPHDFEFDKVFDPLLMFSKKRYAGNMYEENADQCVLKYMGIALKRRDNAPIVKTILGGAIKKLLNEKDVIGATEFVKKTCMDLINGKTSMYQLTITKSLRAEYANPGSIAHKVLADRITKRDPGNAPTAGDRIEYVYVCPEPGQLSAKLQGDRIETPSYARESAITLDYRFYIEHQITNPVAQLFGLLVEQMPGYDILLNKKMPTDTIRRLAWREEQASNILFSECLKKSHRTLSSQTVAHMFRNVQPSILPVAKTGYITHNPDNQIIMPSTTISYAINNISAQCTKMNYDNFIRDGLISKAIKKTRAINARVKAKDIEKAKKTDERIKQLTDKAEKAKIAAEKAKQVYEELCKKRTIQIPV